MNSVAIFLAAVSMGIDSGWQPTKDGQLEYIIQIEPAMMQSLEKGEDIVHFIPPNLRGVRRIRIHVGTGKVPRIGIDGRPAPDDPGINTRVPSSTNATSYDARDPANRPSGQFSLSDRSSGQPPPRPTWRESDPRPWSGNVGQDIAPPPLYGNRSPAGAGAVRNQFTNSLNAEISSVGQGQSSGASSPAYAVGRGVDNVPYVYPLNSDDIRYGQGLISGRGFEPFPAIETNPTSEANRLGQIRSANAQSAYGQSSATPSYNGQSASVSSGGAVGSGYGQSTTPRDPYDRSAYGQSAYGQTPANSQSAYGQSGYGQASSNPSTPSPSLTDRSAYGQSAAGVESSAQTTIRDARGVQRFSDAPAANPKSGSLDSRTGGYPNANQYSSPPTYPTPYGQSQGNGGLGNSGDPPRYGSQPGYPPAGQKVPERQYQPDGRSSYPNQGTYNSNPRPSVDPRQRLGSIPSAPYNQGSSSQPSDQRRPYDAVTRHEPIEHDDRSAHQRELDTAYSIRQIKNEDLVDNDAPRPWGTLAATGIALLASIGGNVYLGFIFFGLHARYRRLLLELHYKSSGRGERSRRSRDSVRDLEDEEAED